jgi:hypothetical protein
MGEAKHGKRTAVVGLVMRCYEQSVDFWALRPDPSPGLVHH